MTTGMNTNAQCREQPIDMGGEYRSFIWTDKTCVSHNWSMVTHAKTTVGIIVITLTSLDSEPYENHITTNKIKKDHFIISRSRGS